MHFANEPETEGQAANADLGNPERIANEILKQYSPSRKQDALIAVYRELALQNINGSMIIVNEKYLVIEGQQYLIAPKSGGLVLKQW
jgi:uncharacterized membrane protein